MPVSFPWSSWSTNPTLNRPYDTESTGTIAEYFRLVMAEVKTHCPDKSATDTISGVWTFSSFPVLPSGNPTGYQPVHYNYFDGNAARKSDALGISFYAVTSGGPTAFTATLSGVASLETGLLVRLKFNDSCNNSPTLNVNSLGAQNIKKGAPAYSGGSVTGWGGALTDLVQGDIRVGQVHEFVYSAADNCWICLTVRPRLMIPHTWTAAGAINVPSGDAYVLPPMFVPVPTGQQAILHSIVHKILSGTSVTFQLKLNDTAVVTGLSATTTKTTYSFPSIVQITDGAELAPEVTAVSGSPKNLSITVNIIYQV